MTSTTATRSRFVSAALSLLGSGASLLFASTANAGPACAADATCPLGFTCQVVGATGCAEPGYYCPPDQPCPAPPPCVTQEIRECAPAPCASDANCGSGMVCYTQTSQNCSSGSAPPCAAGVDCPPPPPPMDSCTATATRTCLPKYMVPCITANDCGAGFTCDHDRACDCFASGGGPTPSSGSGSAGSAGSGGAASAGGAPGTNPAPVPEPDCSCTTLPTAHCTPVPVTCATNADCPSQWTCEHGAAGNACGAPVNPDGTAGPTTCTTIASPSFCAPPYYALIGSRGSSDSTFGGAPTKGGSTGSSTGVAGGAGQGLDPSQETSGTGGQTGTAESGNDQKTGARAKDDGTESGGCQIGARAGSSSPNAIWWGLLGLVGLVRLRRARA